MGTWLAIEFGAAVLAVLAAILPAASTTSEPVCDRAAVEVECEGEGGRGDGEQGAG